MLLQQTVESIEFEKVLALFALHAQTMEGKRWIQEMGLLKRSDQEKHYAMMDCWARYLVRHKPLRFPSIPGQEQFERNPRLDPFQLDELRDLRDTLLFWRRLKNIEELAFVFEEDSQSLPVSEVTHALEGTFNQDGQLDANVTPTYGKLVRQLESARQQLDRQMNGLLGKYGAYLSESIVYERGSRKVLAVQHNFQGRVHGILLDYSSSGRSVYIEPQESTGLQNTIARAERELEEEIWRIRVTLSEKVLVNAAIKERICPILAAMDARQGLARSGETLRCVPVLPNEDGKMQLFHARHPFLDERFAPARREVLGKEEEDNNRMVPFSLHLDESLRGLIISGANTGGKTVTLKTTGLIALLANAGVPIPCDEGSRVPYYEAVFADIGDHQSLSHNLSTYASHLVHLRQILDQAQRPILVLLDELGSGTDPMEGNALSQAVLETLVQGRAQVLVTTHQQILCTFALHHPHFDNGSMAFDHKNLRPTYQFLQGVPGRSHALDIAARAGLSPDLLTRARCLIEEGQLDIQEAIHKLQEQHKQIQKQKQKLRKDELRLHRRIKESKEEASRLKDLRVEFNEREKQRISHQVEKTERQLRHVLSQVKERSQKKQAIKTFSAVKREIMLPFDGVRKIEVAASGLDPSQWQIGDEVFLQTWAQRGTLTGVDRTKVRINCGGKIFTAPIGDVVHLALPEGMEMPQPAEPPKVSEQRELDHENGPRFELRLLGFRLEEAILELDQAIDGALSRELPFMRVIHGHGTGTLKAGIRDYLKHHPNRKLWTMVLDKRNDGVTELHFGDTGAVEREDH